VIETGKTCPRCSVIRKIQDEEKEDAKAEVTETQFQRLEALTSAARFLENPLRNWPDDGKPVPTDYINMAAFLSGLTGDSDGD
jgi:hypothetical protein